MKIWLAPLVLVIGLAPATAQDASPDLDQGFSLIEEGAKLLFRGLMSEMEPALDDLGTALEDLEPGFRSLLSLMGDVRNYHAPEMLENGDILIRRKTPAEIAAPEGPEIEL